MEEQKIVLSESTYSGYLSEHLKLGILRELLMRSEPYAWENIIRCVLEIPKKEEKEC